MFKYLSLFLSLFVIGFAWTDGPAPETPQVRLLFLHGGTIAESHVFYETALQMAKAHRFDVDSLPAGVVGQLLRLEQRTHTNIIFGSYDSYADLGADKRDLIHEYCKKYNVGLFFLYIPRNEPLNGGQLRSMNHARTEDFRLVSGNPVSRLMKDGGVVKEGIFSRHLEKVSGEGYEPLMQAMYQQKPVDVVTIDTGKFDGIKRIFWGYDFGLFWMNELLFLDSLQYLSPVSMGFANTRWFGIDIDDIFQPVHTQEFGLVKMQPEDVAALIEMQEILSRDTESPFKSHVGFNLGWFEKSYNPDKKDAEGDREFVRQREEFFWFDHLPEHQLATTLDEEQLKALMVQSKEWAIKHDVLRLMDKYHVPPHHDGVATKHAPLFKAWKDVWRTEATSTVFSLTGFMHEGVLVMPRTDMGLRWNVHHWTQASRPNLLRGANGGFLFRRLLRNPVSIFMTHQANFAGERPAVEITLEMVKFIKTWTTLKLINLPSDELVRQYFILGAPAYIH